MKTKGKRAIPKKARIDTKTARDQFMSFHKDFELCWAEAKEYYEGSAVRNIYTVIAMNLPEIIERDPEHNFVPMMQYVETLMREGTEAVVGIIAVYFIDSLLSSSQLEPELLAPLLRNLGPLSRDYAIESNAFHGEKSLGLEV